MQVFRAVGVALQFLQDRLFLWQQPFRAAYHLFDFIVQHVLAEIGPRIEQERRSEERCDGDDHHPGELC